MKLTDIIGFVSKFLILITITGLVCCVKAIDNFKVEESIIDTKWTLSKIIDNETGEISEFPKQINNFYLIFKKPGDIELSGFCNFSYGKYDLIETNSLIVTEVGPSTKMFCLPELKMDWEQIFVNSFRNAEIFILNKNQLIIDCSADYDLLFKNED